MPLVTLNNGRTVEIPAEKYYFMSDFELEELMNSNDGDQIENPFYGSALERRDKAKNSIRDLTEINPNEKLADPELNSGD